MFSIAVFLFLTTHWTSPRVRADILDDILSLATSARDRATEARNRATEARDRATEARERATEARNSANELRDNARLGLTALTSQVRDTITEAVEDMQQFVERELEGRDAFIADGGCSLAVCEPFRQDLVSFLQNIQALMNMILSFLELEELYLDFDREVQIINVIPGRALYPLYRVLMVESQLFGPELFDRLDAAVNDLAVLKEALQGPAAQAAAARGDSPPLDSEVMSCTFVMNQYEAISMAKRAVSLHGIMFKVMGKRLKAKGETTAEGANPGIHGYINVTIKDNKEKSVGETLESVSEALSKIAEFADDKLRDCVVYTTLLDSRDRQQEILDAVKALEPPKGGQADLDNDGNVDLADFSLFMNDFGTSGP